MYASQESELIALKMPNETDILVREAKMVTEHVEALNSTTSPVAPLFVKFMVSEHTSNGRVPLEGGSHMVYPIPSIITKLENTKMAVSSLSAHNKNPHMIFSSTLQR